MEAIAHWLVSHYIIAGIAVVLVVLYLVASNRQTGPVEDTADPDTVDQEDENEDNVYDEGCLDLTSAKQKPLCPHCKSALSKIDWVELDDDTVLYSCAGCHVLLDL